jgi:hypothetical protein
MKRGSGVIEAPHKGLFKLLQDPSAVLYGSFGLHIALRTGQYGAICLLNSATSGEAPPVLLNKKI